MTVRARMFTDPACPWSWAAEPALRRLAIEFGDELSWTPVLGGLARSYPDDPKSRGKRMAHWLDVAAETRAPMDPRLWSDGGIRSTYPACMAVKAAWEQGSAPGAAFLRSVREGLMCFRRRLDAPEGLVEEARRVGLDTERFRRDLASSATTEAFGADLEAARLVPEEARADGDLVTDEAGRERLSFPTVAFEGGEARRWVFGFSPYEDYRAAAEAAGARPAEAPAPSVVDAVRRFERMTTPEVEAACDLPGPRASAELWRLASEWRVRPVRVLGGELWEAV